MSAPRLSAIKVPASPGRQLETTIRLIGRGILAGSVYQPLRLHAATLAARAAGQGPPGGKPYLAQARAIYDDFLTRWRYVRDPAALETVATSGPAIWGIIGGNYTAGNAPGHGDCDDATVFLGASFQAIGLPVRIVTMAAPGQRQMSHVYPEVEIPGFGWIPADPVAHPRPFGAHPPAALRIRWDLEGRQITPRRARR